MEVYSESPKMMKRISMLAIVFFIGCMSSFAKKRALLIGIGNYDFTATGWSVIHGNNDVALLESKLIAKGFSVSYLIDNRATKSNVKTALSNFVASVTAGDIIYLHFSGHGQLIEDMNNDEQEDLDQSFVCYDACFSSKYKVSGTSYRGQNHFVDDEMFTYLNNLKRKVGKSGAVIVVFDTCYSGGADRGEQADRSDLVSDVEWIDTTRGTDDEFKANASAETYLRTIRKPGNYTAEGGRITIISACESDKKNYECKERHSGRKYGSLSYCIGKMLDMNIPINQWETYFLCQKFRTLHIIRPSQNPVVESYK